MLFHIIILSYNIQLLFNISFFIQDTEIAVDDLGVVMEKLWDARTKWYYIGVQFGITVSDLDVIEMEPKSDVTEMFRKMIMTWLKKGENCTWRTVYDALKHCTVEQQRIAENLKSWLVKGEL